MNAGASAGRMPANVSESERARVIAGFAKAVEAVNQYPAPIQAATIHGTSCARRYPRTTRSRPNVATASATAFAAVLGLCDRRRPHRSGACDSHGRAGSPRRDPADHHVRVLHPAGARAGAPGQSHQPLQLDRERAEPRSDQSCLGRGGLAYPGEGPVRSAIELLRRLHSASCMSSGESARDATQRFASTRTHAAPSAAE